MRSHKAKWNRTEVKDNKTVFSNTLLGFLRLKTRRMSKEKIFIQIKSLSKSMI